MICDIVATLQYIGPQKNHRKPAPRLTVRGIFASPAAQPDAPAPRTREIPGKSSNPGFPPLDGETENRESVKTKISEFPGREYRKMLTFARIQTSFARH